MVTGSDNSRIRPEWLDAGEAGRYYNTGRGPLTVAGGQAFRLLGINPVGSGKLLVIHRLRFYASTPSEFLEIRINPTTNLPTFALPSTSQRLGSPNGIVQVRADVGAAMSGGTLSPYQIPIVVGELTEFHIDPGRIIPPGVSIGLNFTNTTGGASRAIVLADWTEEPLDV